VPLEPPQEGQELIRVAAAVKPQIDDQPLDRPSVQRAQQLEREAEEVERTPGAVVLEVERFARLYF
jgi:hypothetical protein